MRLQSDRKVIAKRLQSDRQAIAKRLKDDCKAIAKRLKNDCKLFVIIAPRISNASASHQFKYLAKNQSINQSKSTNRSSH
jgi:hypothetical protein